MLNIIGPIYAKYGVSTAIYFTLSDPSSTTKAYTGTDVPAADSFIYKDGAAGAATTNAVYAGASPNFNITLTAAEMSATNITVRITDVSGSVYVDTFIFIVTKLKVGQFDVDASQITNASAILLAANGTGSGISSTGGATGNGGLFTGGSSSGDGLKATSVAGNGNGLRGVGVGTGLGLKTEGASALYKHDIFDQSEGTEPSAALSSTATLREIFQWLKRRLNNKVTVDGSNLKVYKDDSSTVLSTQSVSDNGTTDTVGKAS